ncbi:MAG: hypothetical protein IKP36_05170 [Bacteroidaceae bacterium]|nr:hypothetical protein [Bacteroidaceae bacterium]
MATTERRSAREIRLQAIVELQNELNSLFGEEPVNEQEYIAKYSEYKLHELGTVKEGLVQQIEKKKHQNKVDAYFAGEGKELFAKLESRKATILKNLKDIQDRLCEKAEQSFADTVWHVCYAGVSYGNACVRIVLKDESGKEIFGTELTITYSESIFSKGKEEFTTNVGTCGSNEILDDSYGSRTFFYIQLGKLFQRKDMLETLRAEMKRLVESFHKNNHNLHNVESVLADPFTKELEESDNEDD